MTDEVRTGVKDIDIEGTVADDTPSMPARLDLYRLKVTVYVYAGSYADAVATVEQQLTGLQK